MKQTKKRKVSELARMDRLRAVMKLSSRGRGMGASLVETFGESDSEEEQKVVRSILLGHPVDESTAELLKTGGHARDLLSFLVQQAKINASEASRRADRLASLFEHWVRAQQARIVDQRILETRSIMVSAILGGVTAMVATIAPVLSSFQLTLSADGTAALAAGTAIGYAQYLGLFFVVPGSFFLGLFFSPRRALLNVAISCTAYLFAAYLFAPLVVAL